MAEDQVVMAEDQVVMAEDQVVMAEDQVVMADDQVVMAEDQVVIAEDQVVMAGEIRIGLRLGMSERSLNDWTPSSDISKLRSNVWRNLNFRRNRNGRRHRESWYHSTIHRKHVQCWPDTGNAIDPNNLE